MSKAFEVRVTRIVIDRYIIAANNQDQAEEIAIFGDLEPYRSDVTEERIDAEEVGPEEVD